MACALPAKKKWTFMVYLAGDNNLDANGVEDLEEMKSVGSGDDINLLAQFDRFGAKGETRRFYLRRKTGLAKDTVAKLGETNSGSPEALIDFIVWGIKNYPASRYALVLWNHGGGWDDTDVYADARLRAVHRPARGPIRHAFFRSVYEDAVQKAARGAGRRAILYDDDARDFLDNLEMKKVLAAARRTAGRKIDLLGMDACLMSMAEVACQVRSGARCAVGSEQTEPVDGWPYHTLLAGLAAQPDMNAETFASFIVGKYLASYPASEPVTQSAFDLAEAPRLLTAVRKLARTLREELADENCRLAILQARLKAQSYETADNIDLVDFCKLLCDAKAATAAIREACGDVVDAVCGPNGLVIASGFKGAPVRNSYGAAIYFPTQTLSPLYAKLDFAKKTGWGGFLKRYLNASRRR